MLAALAASPRALAIGLPFPGDQLRQFFAVLVEQVRQAKQQHAALGR